MKQFTLIEQDRYIKIDGTGIFFTPEDWPFADIEHLWAIQWKDDGTPDGEGWVEYDSPIPNTPIAKCQIEKYVDHHTTELNKQIEEQKRKEEEEKKKSVSWEEAMAELELQMDSMQKNHDEYVKDMKDDHDMQMQRLYQTTEMHEKEHQQQMEFLMKDHELQIERIQIQTADEQRQIFDNQDVVEDVAKESKDLFENEVTPDVTLFDGEVDESLFDDVIDDKYFENVVEVSPDEESKPLSPKELLTNETRPDTFFKNFDLSTLDDEFDLDVLFDDESDVESEIDGIIANDDKAQVTDNQEEQKT